MRLITLLLMAALSITFTVSHATTLNKQASTALPIYSKIYDAQRDPFNDAVAAITLANTSNRQVLIEIGGNWCTWCHKLDDFLAKNPDIAKQLHQHFVLLKINVSDTNENEKFMQSLPPVLGYPHMYVSNNQGQVVLSKDTAELQDEGGFSRERFLEFIEKWRVKS